MVVPAARTSSAARLGSDTEVPPQLRQNTGYMDDHWAAAAAGHVEQGETAFDAAHREALEEIGVTDLDPPSSPRCSARGAGEPIDERIDFFFTARSWSVSPDPRGRQGGRAAVVPPRRPPRAGRASRARRVGGPANGYDNGVLDVWLRPGGHVVGLGPQPEPQIEPGEPNPGGVDAQPEERWAPIPDLSPDENPAIDEKAPDPPAWSRSGGRGHLDRGHAQRRWPPEESDKESPA